MRSDNAVQVITTKRQAAAAKELVAKYGDAVSIEISDAAPEPAANWMDGGDGINGNSCSAGFNLRNPSTGARFLLTAGHCVSTGSTLRGQGAVNFGPVLESWFPTFDDALARNTNTGYWIQGPWVDTNPSNGGIVTTSGHTDLPRRLPDVQVRHHDQVDLRHHHGQEPDRDLHRRPHRLRHDPSQRLRRAR